MPNSRASSSYSNVLSRLDISMVSKFLRFLDISLTVAPIASNALVFFWLEAVRAYIQQYAFYYLKLITIESHVIDDRFAL